MSDKTGIQWTDATWNPVIGCRRVSEGCRNCYAEHQAARIVEMQRGNGKRSPYEDVVRQWQCQTCGLGPSAEGCPTCHGHGFVPKPAWSGRAVFLPERLDQPLRWRKPRMVFVNSMSDLFHEDVTFEQIAAVFGVMAASPKHTFQVLTKRPERMVEFLGDDGRGIAAFPWPLPNVWLGVSVEDQKTADERIPLLLQCPAAVRWVSAEPLLGPVDFWDFFSEIDRNGEPSGPARVLLDWIVVGGESGAEARPCAIAWIRGIVEQCADAGVPCFVKQLGSNPRQGWHDGTAYFDEALPLKRRKGGDISEFPETLRVREYPNV